MKRKTIFIQILGLVLTQGNLLWADSTGSAGAVLLRYNFSPRAEAMGEAWTAIADDAHSIFWNPSGLSYMTRNEFSTAFSKGLTDDFLGNISGAYIYSRDITFGAGFLGFSGGSFDRTDALGNVETINAQADYALALSGAYRIDESWSVGATLEGLHSTLVEKETGMTMSATFGVSYKPDFLSPIRAGLAVRNLGPPISYGGGIGDPLPLTAQIGVAYQILKNTSDNPTHALTAAVDGVWNLDAPIYANAGVEYWFQEMIALRVGYKFNRAIESITCGLGAKIPVLQNMLVQFDYSIGFSSILEYIHKAALSFYFPENADRWTEDKWKQKLKADQEAAEKARLEAEAKKRKEEEEKARLEAEQAKQKKMEELKAKMPPITLQILEKEMKAGTVVAVILSEGTQKEGVARGVEGIIYNPGRELAGTCKLVEVYERRSRAIITQMNADIKEGAFVELVK